MLYLTCSNWLLLRNVKSFPHTAPLFPKLGNTHYIFSAINLIGAWSLAGPNNTCVWEFPVPVKASTLVTSHVSFSTDTCQDATGVPFVAWCEAGPADPATKITWRITGENFTQYYTGDSTELCFENLCTTASVIRVTSDDAAWNVLPEALHTLKCISTQTIPTEEPRVLETTGNLHWFF